MAIQIASAIAATRWRPSKFIRVMKLTKSSEAKALTLENRQVCLAFCVCYLYLCCMSIGGILAVKAAGSFACGA
jgi:hypothetical protein